MRGDANRISTDGGDDRGLSPLVGLLLLMGIVFVSIVLIITVGFSAYDGLNSQASAERSEQLMLQFDTDLRTAMVNDDATGAVYLDENGNYTLSENGTIEITVSNGYEEEGQTVSMGTLQYEDDAGNRFAHQAGGVWRVEESGTTVVSDPDIRYYTETNDGEEVGRIDLSIMDLQGNAGQGEHTVRQEESAAPDFDDIIEDIGFVSHVTVTVSDTPYHDAWYEFLKSEFDAVDYDDSPTRDDNVVRHYEDDQKVTITANIDGDNPFANQVGIEPTIYGGLYVDGIASEYDTETDFTAYDDHDSDTNPSEDLFVVNDGFTLANDANITGVPVANGEIGVHSGAAVDPLAYTADLDDPDGVADDGVTEYAWYNNYDMVVAQLSEPFDSVSPIDDELTADDGAISYLDGAETTDLGSYGDDTVEAGLYHGSSLDPDIDEIDTADGDVHIGIDGDLSLEDIEVTGPNRVYIYTDGDVTVTDVEVPDDRAKALWVYGTSGNTISVEGDYEGVMYAPESDLEIDDEVTITGAITAGELREMGEDVTVNFDRTLRTDVPIPEENRDVDVEERLPLDVSFVLDRSGSMGEHGVVSGDDWQRSPYTNLAASPWAAQEFPTTVDPDADRGIQVRSCGYGGCDSPETIEPGETGTVYMTHDVRVDGDCDDCEVDIWYGNDPFGVRADETKNFIDILNASNDDRAGVYQFNDGGTTSHELSYDLDDVSEAVTADAGGGTDIAAGMEPALDTLEAESQPNRKQVMVLLSDGENSGSDAPTKDQAQRAADTNVTIFTIGLGEENIDRELLEEDITTEDGEFFMIDDAEELTEIFEGIANDITTDSDISFEVQSLSQVTETSGDYVLNVETQTVTLES